MTNQTKVPDLAEAARRVLDALDQSGYPTAGQEALRQSLAAYEESEAARREAVAELVDMLPCLLMHVATAVDSHLAFSPDLRTDLQRVGRRVGRRLARLRGLGELEAAAIWE